MKKHQLVIFALSACFVLLAGWNSLASRGQRHAEESGGDASSLFVASRGAMDVASAVHAETFRAIEGSRRVMSKAAVGLHAAGLAAAPMEGASHKTPKLGHRRRPPASTPEMPSRLTVGLWDDNANFDAFDEFSRSLTTPNSTAGQQEHLPPARDGFPPVDHRDRVRVVVRDKSSGMAVTGADVKVHVAGMPLETALVMRTGSGGVVTILPRALFPLNTSIVAELAVTVGKVSEVVRLQPLQHGDVAKTSSLEFTADLNDLSSANKKKNDDGMTLKYSGAPHVTGIDVAIVLDTTGSMGDELRFISGEVANIAQAIVQRYPNIKLRFAVVMYRDVGDEYVVKGLDFSPSVEQTAQRLTGETAAGGGDYPEAAEQALHFANDNLSWSPDPTVLRLAFWIADAPHHNENAKAMAAAIVNASLKGIRIYPVAGSGANDLLEFTMRSAALATSGRYMFLTDHSGIGESHKEPRIPCYFVTNLKHAMERCISMELTGGAFVQPAQGEVIAVVGDVQDRRCQTRSGRTVLVA